MSLRRLIDRACLLLAVVGTGGAFWVLLAPRQPAHPALVGPHFERLDLDSDGRIGPEEYDRLGPGDLPLQVYDLDGDGVLGRAEIETFLVHVNPLAFAKGRLTSPAEEDEDADVEVELPATVPPPAGGPG